MYPIVSKHFYMAGSHRHSKNILNIKEANISIKLPTSPDIRYEAMKYEISGKVGSLIEIFAF